jgi:hypothetical protein
MARVEDEGVNISMLCEADPSSGEIGFDCHDRADRSSSASPRCGRNLRANG